ncbi:hypothetical protein [Pelagibacterium luteolum]|uniref:Uncharacterized protein n=1 Tax=Pelagibacterium luteolum TaxID=440168 RepID=A0A1G7ZHA1_9HYPH|nr:hypothetical protein [Pelagibacterium luteolum]SDH08009.1 hypothetical protein SAMN04487974_12014 [Pelagibacterium luteolum]
MITAPKFDMTGWAILDFELAYDGLQQLNLASLSIQNQPRASRSDHSYYPGADFIADIGETYVLGLADALIKRLEQVRFANPADEDRRLRLLMHHHCSFGSGGDTLPELLQRMAFWSAKPVVAA